MTYSEWQKKYGAKAKQPKATESVAKKAEEWHKKYKPPRTTTTQAAKPGVIAGTNLTKQELTARAIDRVSGIDNIAKADAGGLMKNSGKVAYRDDGGTRETRFAEANAKNAAAKKAEEDAAKERERLRTFDYDAARQRIKALQEERKAVQAEKKTTQDHFASKLKGKSYIDENYERLREIDSKISDIEADIYMADRVREADGYNALPNNADFNEKSGYIPSVVIGSNREQNALEKTAGRLWGYESESRYRQGSRDVHAVSEALNTGSVEDKDAILHDYINGAKYAIEGVHYHDAQVAAYPEALNETYRKYRMLTKNELDRYNYLHNTEGGESAKRYLSALENTLNSRLGQTAAAGLNDAQKVALGLKAGVDNFNTGIKQMFTEDVKPTTATQYAGQTARENLGKGGQFAYDFAQLVGNMAPSILLSTAMTAVGGAAGIGALASAAPVVGSASMGMSAYGNAYADMMQRTGNKEKSKAYAALVGASESTLSYLLSGVSALGGKAVSASRVAKAISSIGNIYVRTAAEFAKAGISEGVEETLQEYLEPMFYSAVFGGDYEAPEFKDAARTFLLAALSGGMFEGGNIVSSEITAVNNMYKEMYKEPASLEILVDKAFSLNDTKATELATAIQKKVEAGEDVSGAEIRKLAERGAKVTNARGKAAIRSQTSADAATAIDFLVRKHEASKTKKTGLETAAQEMERKTEGVRRADAKRILENPTARDALKEYGYKVDAEDQVASVRGAIKAMAEAGVDGKTAVAAVLKQDAKEAPTDSVTAEGNTPAPTADTTAENIPAEGKFEGNTEVMENGEGNLHLRYGSERNDGANPSVQVPAMETGTGRNQGGEETSDRPKDAGAASLSYTEEVDASTVVKGGQNRISLLKDGETKAIKEAKALGAKLGLDVVFFRGDNLKVIRKDKNGKDRLVTARAMLEGNKMYVRVDHPDFDAYQLARHEAAHDMINNKEIDVEKIRDRINEIFNPAEIEQIVESYLELYYGSDMTAKQAWEEIVCDAMGDMNVFALVGIEENAPAVLESIKKTANETRTEKTRGPPADRAETQFSFDGISKDGRRVYSSEFAKSVDESARLDAFKKHIETIFNLGAVELKTDVKKLNIMADKFTFKKNIFGDDHATVDEMRAKINALYDLADILSTATYDPSATQLEESYANKNIPPKNKAHEDVKYWYKFRNKIVFDGVPYTVTFNIRDKGKNQIQYLIEFKKDKTSGISHTGVSTLRQTRQMSYANSITHLGEKSTEKTSKSDFSEELDIKATNISAIDREYLSLAKDPVKNEAKLQEMVDAAAKKAGNTYHLYHGTDEDFTRFDLRKFGGRNGKGEGYGIYLAANREVSAPYGKNVIDSYVKFNRLAEGRKKTLSLAEVKKIVKESCKVDAQRAVDGGEYDTISEAIRDTWVSNYVYTYEYPSMERVYSDVAKTLWENNDNDGEIINEIMASAGSHYDYNNALDFYETVLTPTTGIDGFHYVWGNKDGSGVQNDIYLAFYSNQIKSADPVTYDDNGNVIPLSERFNEKNEDIRFSEELTTLSDLRKDNERLRKQIVRLKGEMKVTEKPTVRRDDVEKLSRRLIREYHSTLTANDIADSAQDLAHFLVRNGDGTHELTFDGLKRRAEKVAEKIVRSAEVLNDEAWQNYAELRSYLKMHKFTLTADEASSIPDFMAWKKANRKYLSASIGETNVDKIYSEMSDRWPEFFNENRETNPADQLLQIVDTLERITPIYENPYDFNISAAIEYAANDIVDSLLSPDVRQVRTYADRAAAKLQRANDARREALRTRRETASARALRGKILSHAAKLYQDLGTIRKTRNIPEELRAPVAAVLDAINFESKHTVVEDENGRRHVAPKGVEGDPTKRTTKFAALKAAYQKLAGSISIDPNIIGMGDQPGILDNVISMADVRIDDMNARQLEDVWSVIRSMEQAITTWNKAFRAGKAETISEVADHIYAENAFKKSRDEFKHGGFHKLLEVDNLTPEAYFHRIGKVGDSLFRMLRNAQDEQIRILAETTEFAHKAIKESVGKEGVRKLDRSIVTVRLGNKDVKMTASQLMELYALTRRPHALMHILTGGIRLDSMDIGKNKLLGRSDVIRNITEDELNKAFGKLTEGQKKLADILQDYSSTKLGAYGNRASMEVYGVKKYTEEYYWPIRTHTNDTKRDQETAKVKASSMANKGFTNQVKPDAKTSLRIGSLFDTFANHSVEMSAYSAFLAPMEDLDRIRNYKFHDGDGIASVGDLLNLAVGRGDQGAEYLAILMEDLSVGVAAKDTDINPMSQLIGNYKAASVGANVRVIMQQWTAGLRAFDIIDPKYFASKSTPNKGWEKALKYAPIAQWKDWGYFDVHTGRQIKDVMFDSDSALDKAKQIGMAGAGWMDSMTWGVLWNACENEVADKNKDIKRGTDAFYKKVAERFNEVVDHTQVVDGILQRSQIMRAPGLHTKIATAFLAEPTKQINMVMSAVSDYRNARTKDKKAEAGKKLRRTALSLCVAGIVNGTLGTALIDGLRDDDDEKNYWEKILSAMTGLSGDEKTVGDYVKSLANGNVLEQFNPLGMIPIVKNVWSEIQGFTGKDIDEAALSDIVTAVNTLVGVLQGDGKKSATNASLDLAGAIATAFGLPIKNVKRDVLALTQTIISAKGTPLVKYRYAKLMMNPSENKKAFLAMMYDAYKNDKDAYEIIRKDLLREGFTEEDLDGGIKSGIKTAFDLSGYVEDKAKKNNYIYSELEKLGGGKASNVMPDDMSPVITYKDDKDKEITVQLNEKEYAKFQKDVGDKAFEILKNTVGGAKWKSMTDDEKKSAISYAYQIARAYGKQNASGYEADDKWLVKALEKAEHADEIVTYKAMRMSYDKNKDGKLNATERNAAINAIAKTEEEKRLLRMLS